MTRVHITVYLHQFVVGSNYNYSKPCGRHHYLVDHYGISVSQMTTDMFRLSLALSGHFLIHDLSPGL